MRPLNENVSSIYLTGPGRKLKKEKIPSAGTASEKDCCSSSLSALVNDQDVLEVETGLDDKEMVP